MAHADDTGNGQIAIPNTLASVAVANGVPTAEHLPRSRKADSPADKKLTGQEVLSILENALKLVRLEWSSAKVLPPGTDSTPVILSFPIQVRYCQRCHHFRVLSDMRVNLCVFCVILKEEETENGHNKAA